MQAIATEAAGAGRHLPAPFTAAMERQIELVRELVEREQAAQRELIGRAFEPFDAIFDLLEGSAAALAAQADALSSAARALEQAGDLVRTQAELSERTLRALRAPADLARSAAGAEPRPRARRPRNKP